MLAPPRRQVLGRLALEIDDIPVRLGEKDLAEMEGAMDAGLEGVYRTLEELVHQRKAFALALVERLGFRLKSARDFHDGLIERGEGSLDIPLHGRPPCGEILRRDRLRLGGRVAGR